MSTRDGPTTVGTSGSDTRPPDVVVMGIRPDRDASGRHDRRSWCRNPGRRDTTGAPRGAGRHAIARRGDRPPRRRRWVGSMTVQSPTWRSSPRDPALAAGERRDAPCGVATPSGGAAPTQMSAASADGHLTARWHRARDGRGGGGRQPVRAGCRAWSTVGPAACSRAARWWSSQHCCGDAGEIAPEAEATPRTVADVGGGTIERSMGATAATGPRAQARGTVSLAAE